MCVLFTVYKCVVLTVCIISCIELVFGYTVCVKLQVDTHTDIHWMHYTVPHRSVHTVYCFAQCICIYVEHSVLDTLYNMQSIECVCINRMPIDMELHTIQRGQDP